MQNFLDGFMKFAEGTGIALLINPDTYIWWQTILMIAIACVLLYLAIVKKFEPLLLVPIAFGMLLANLPQTANIMHPEWFSNPEFFVNGHIDFGKVLNEGGLLDLLYLGVKLGIYPAADFPRNRRDDGLWPADCEPEEHPARRGGTDWCILYVPRRALYRRHGLG